MQDFSMDTKTWQATIGGGTKLADVTKKLHDNGKRAISHGTCPGVGIGGHATIVSVLIPSRISTLTRDPGREDLVHHHACGDHAWIMS